LGGLQTIRDILDSAKVLLTSSEGITLSNLIKFSWGKITQLTDREIYNYFSQLTSELKDSQLFNEYLVDFDMDMHLATYLNSLDIDTIKTKYPAILATELSKELLIQYFQKKAKPEELTLLHRDIYGSRLKEEGKLLFSELYLARLAQEGWIVLDWKDNPRLSDPASYFNEHNNDWIGQSSFLSLTEDYHIYYSNPELSWINIENEGKQFILDVLQRYGVGTLKAALLKTKEDIKVKDIVNTLVQTPQDLNIYFEGTTSAKFLEFSRWLCEDGLYLTVVVQT
jgi:hypothetical protein